MIMGTSQRTAALAGALVALGVEAAFLDVTEDSVTVFHGIANLNSVTRWGPVAVVSTVRELKKDPSCPPETLIIIRQALRIVTLLAVWEGEFSPSRNQVEAHPLDVKNWTPD